ncbi:hypothetical protein CRUP_014936 [Coryphaenoides rupestris]|nr:hypothetical protein CRUP_014936 [Coryphaenoides rupestris]
MNYLVAVAVAAPSKDLAQRQSCSQNCDHTERQILRADTNSILTVTGNFGGPAGQRRLQERNILRKAQASPGPGSQPRPLYPVHNQGSCTRFTTKTPVPGSQARPLAPGRNQDPWTRFTSNEGALALAAAAAVVDTHTALVVVAVVVAALRARHGTARHCSISISISSSSSSDGGAGGVVVVVVVTMVPLLMDLRDL